MTRTHAAVQLLRHGPLTMPSFIKITGWQPLHARRTINHLCDVRGDVKRVGRGKYRLTDWTKEL